MDLGFRVNLGVLKSRFCVALGADRRTEGCIDRRPPFWPTPALTGGVSLPSPALHLRRGAASAAGAQDLGAFLALLRQVVWSPACRGMDGLDRDLGWEDVGQGEKNREGGAIAGQAGPDIHDAVTSAMVNHFARELTHGSLSLWPQIQHAARRYFNVTHGYVLRKMLWQLAPSASPKKKSVDGELGAEKDWSARIFEGLEADIEEPDMYIPAMGFVTYVLLCGLIRGLQDQFHPDVLYTSISFAVIVLVLEVTVVKGALFMAGAVNAPVFDIVALTGYKYFYLSLQLASGLVLFRGHRPEGFLYHLVALGLAASCGLAFWQALRRLARMQPAQGKDFAADVHKMLVKGAAAGQVLICWLLLPSWPKVLAATAAGVARQAAASTGARAAVNATAAALAGRR